MDEAWVKIIYDRYYKEMFEFLYGLTHDRDLTEELCDVTFLAFLNKYDEPGGIQEEDEGGARKGLLCTIARRKLTDHWRRANRAKEALPELAERIRAIDDDITNVQDEEISAALIGALARLPELEQIVVYMRYYQNLSYAEMATILRKKVGALARLHKKALAKLRWYLAGWNKR